MVNIFFIGLHIASLHISLLLINLKSHFLKYRVRFECTMKDHKIKHFSKVYPLTDKFLKPSFSTSSSRRKKKMIFRTSFMSQYFHFVF